MERLSAGIEQYANNLDALREFVEVLAPVLQERSVSEMEQSTGTFAEFTNLVKQLPIADNGEIDRELVAQRNELVKTLPIVVESAKRLKNSVFHQMLLYRVSLVTLVSTAEWFVSELLHSYFELYPNALDIDNRKLSFKDIQAFESFDGARTYLVDKEIEGFLRGSIEDWLILFEKRCKLSMGYIDGDVKDELIETYQRRNLLVHNGGRINSLYRKRVSEHLRWEGRGDSVEVPEDYLSDRIGTFEKAFILIGAELWKKISPSDDGRFQVLSEIIWGHLKAERWDIARSLTRFAMNDKQLPEVSQLIACFNYWQCQKWLGRFEEVEKEVREADLSAKEPRFRLGQLALLEKHDDFVTLARKLVDKEDLTMDDLQTWPIFKETRKTGAFKRAFPKNGDAESSTHVNPVEDL